MKYEPREYDAELTPALPAAEVAAAAQAASFSEDEYWRGFEALRERLWLIAAAITRSPQDADDVVQEAAMTGLRRRSTFTPGTNLAAWLGQITRLTALGHLRSSGRGGRTSTDAAPGLGDVSAPAMHAGLSQAEALARLDEALARLDETPRSCLLLRVVGGLSYQAISEVLQIPEGTAMSHVSRARAQVRLLVQSQDGERMLKDRRPAQVTIRKAHHES